MNQHNVRLYLSALGVKSMRVSGAWVSCPCPLAPWLHDSGKDSNPSFAVRVIPDGDSWYNCFTCGGGDLYELVKKMSDFSADGPQYRLRDAMDMVAQEGTQTDQLSLAIKDWEDTDEQGSGVVPFPEPFIQSFPFATNVPMAREYLQSRGVCESASLSLEIRWDFSKKAVVFPIRDFSGVLVGLRGRYIDPKPGSPRYHAYVMHGSHNKLPWLGESWVDQSKPVLMVESVFDLARVLPVYENVMAPLSVGITKAKAARVDFCFEIVTLFDVGVGGNRARDAVSRYFPDAVVQHLLPPSDSAGLDGGPATDPGNMTTAQIEATLAQVGLTN